MIAPAEQFPFVEMDPIVGAVSLMPMLPMILSRGQKSFPVSGLLDTGAAINVLPHSIGIDLGADWKLQTTPVRLTGNRQGIDARVLAASAQVGQFNSVQLLFAWAESDAVPIILGQTNFFMEFDACFFRARSVFEVRPRS